MPNLMPETYLVLVGHVSTQVQKVILYQNLHSSTYTYLMCSSPYLLSYLQHGLYLNVSKNSWMILETGHALSLLWEKTISLDQKRKENVEDMVERYGKEDIKYDCVEMCQVGT